MLQFSTRLELQGASCVTPEALPPTAPSHTTYLNRTDNLFHTLYSISRVLLERILRFGTQKPIYPCPPNPGALTIDVKLNTAVPRDEHNNHHWPPREPVGNFRQQPQEIISFETCIDATSEVGRSLPDGRQLLQARGGRCAAAERVRLGRLEAVIRLSDSAKEVGFGDLGRSVRWMEAYFDRQQRQPRLLGIK